MDKESIFDVLLVLNSYRNEMKSRGFAEDIRRANNAMIKLISHGIEHENLLSDMWWRYQSKPEDVSVWRFVANIPAVFSTRIHERIVTNAHGDTVSTLRELPGMMKAEIVIYNIKDVYSEMKRYGIDIVGSMLDQMDKTNE